jgi:hypothetical protein
MPRILLATLLSVILVAPLLVSAGDDVDYSAPYLVVEDGELVTKYPAQEHDGVSTDTDVPAGVDTENNWRIAGAVMLAVAAAFFMLRRGRRRTEKAD